LVSGVSPDDFLAKLQALIALLNIDGLTDFAADVAKATETPGPVRSVLPDWDSLALKNIPPFNDLYKSLKGWLAQFRGYLETADSFLDDFITAVENKVTSIANAVTALNNAINAIISGAGVSGAYWLDIPQTQGGNSYLKDELVDSPFGDSAFSQNKYTAMVVFVAGGPNAAGLETFKGILA